MRRSNSLQGFCKVSAAAALAVTVPISALAAPTSAQICESGKNKTANNYVDCLSKAQAKLVYGYIDGAGHDAAVAACGDKYDAKWTKLETAAGGMCPSNGDAGGVQDFLDACIFAVEDALSGGTLPADVVTCNDDLATCGSDLSAAGAALGDCQGDLATANDDLSACQDDLAECEARPIGQVGRTGQFYCQDVSGDVIPCAGTGLDAEFQYGLPTSFTDNGDGTITDNNTGLVWEKMSDDGSIHDQDDTYSLPDAIGIKIATLNAMNFGGHSDWRLPNVKEMMSILDYSGVYAGFASSCTGGCSVLSCNCIVYNAHWTSTNNAYHGFFGLQVNLFNGTVPTDYKTAPGLVRAVRGGA